MYAKIASANYFKRLNMLVDATIEIGGEQGIGLNFEAIDEDFYEGGEHYIKLGDMEALLDLYRKPVQHPLYDMVNRYFVTVLGKTFNVRDSVPNIIEFEFKLEGNLTSVKVVTDTDTHFDETVEMTGKADRLWICRLLSGLMPALNLTSFADKDFIFSLKDRKLGLVDLSLSE